MARLEPSETFWSRPELVAAYQDIGGALQYEIDAVAASAEAARRTGPVDSVHVLGVGGGRELGAIRAITNARVIHAWDISEPMVQACRQHVTRSGWQDVIVNTSSIEDLERPGGESADLVVALGAVLGYSTDESQRCRSVGRISSLLRDGGAFAGVVQQRNGRPDWALYFAARSLLERTPWCNHGIGNRRSRHGSGSVLFHHYTPAELIDLFAREGFTDVQVGSLRAWARQREATVPLRSPNPLVLTATKVADRTTGPAQTR